MKAIITKIIPQTHTKPTRIRASAQGVKSIIYSKDSIENELEAFGVRVVEQNVQRHVALKFRDANNWTHVGGNPQGPIQNLASGQLPNRDWVHCFIPDTHTRKPETPPENPEDSHGWRCVVKHLFDTLKANGIEVVGVDNGEGEVQGSLSELLNEADACDECRVYVKTPDATGTRWLYVVLGNEPFELVADYSTGSLLLDKVLTAWSDAWEDIPLVRKPFPPTVPTV